MDSAFPHASVFDPQGAVIAGQEAGMTLRDYIAAKAMQAMLQQRCYPWDSQMPSDAYKIADAMLKARG